MSERVPHDSGADAAAPDAGIDAAPHGARAADDAFDVVVVGAGHAGCEAAAACARLGVHVALVTADPIATARMSCNPAVGGVAKGHMVREVDALGGLMARITDRAGIQFKLLNRGRGPAVWSPRVQCDKGRYSEEMARAIDAIAGIARVTGVVNRVRVERGAVAGVELDDGRVLAARAVVLTPGTFLNGVMHVGDRRTPGGRVGEHAAHALSECLAALGLARGRLKTGTPPRLHRDSIDWSALRPQPGDDPPEPMSHWTDALDVEQALCWLTHTNARTHACVRGALHLSPLHSGAITGIGPRYCPCIEDKVVRFADKPSHQIFLEPEGRHVPEIYVNGFSTSLPAEAQLAAVRTLPGLDAAELIRPGYAVEYDFVLPHQLDATLQVRDVRGAWLAGQICGTSGYEEAAAQGIVAGINAALFVQRRAPFVLGRDRAYIGVLVDDLVTREHREPYRMFTSAAEHRLLLRADNADERLCETAHALGLVTAEQLERVRAKVAAITVEQRRLARTRVRVPDRAGAAAPRARDAGARDAIVRDAAVRDDGAPTACGATPRVRGITALDWLSRPDASYAALATLGVTPRLPSRWGAALEVRVRYRGYIERQTRTAARATTLERLALPDALWSAPLEGLSREALEKLRRLRPATLGQAGRVAGVSPADLALLMVFARRLGQQQA
ncbi:MAG TPA: tRNA uridine-5-carboxymethylaminomethyl(34) synthesis enzyme MnmG [Candidatus Eisenbacteria bacterium]|nr:tRNA uridine-5-carboxymethylaminomethyl(34) synthesis enzyme MnmG [Candidatus Eisenbacteria bacterium]